MPYRSRVKRGVRRGVRRDAVQKQIQEGGQEGAQEGCRTEADSRGRSVAGSGGEIHTNIREP
eukprot:5665794-Pyramimonas_sp.AAC.1